MQRILVLKPFVVAKANGGEIALLERLRLFQDWGLKVEIVIAQPESERENALKILEAFKTPITEWKSETEATYLVDGILCRIHFSENFHPFELQYQSSMEEFFSSEIQKFQSDLVLTHYTDFYATTAGIKWDASKTWVDQTDDEYPRLEHFKEYPSLFEPYQRIKHFIVASEFMRLSVKKEFPDSEIHLLPNIISTIQNFKERSELPDKKASWIFINPTPVKGVDFVLQLAQAMPEENFIFIGNWNTELPKDLPRNIRAISRQNDIQFVLSHGKGLLMPSVWNEAFGRMPLEAMAAGIPVISSDRGALRDTVGSGGIVLSLEIELWKKAMAQSDEIWRQKIRDGYNRVRSYLDAVNRTYQQLKQSWNL